MESEFNCDPVFGGMQALEASLTEELATTLPDLDMKIQRFSDPDRKCLFRMRVEELAHEGRMLILDVEQVQTGVIWKLQWCYWVRQVISGVRELETLVGREINRENGIEI